MLQMTNSMRSLSLGQSPNVVLRKRSYQIGSWPEMMSQHIFRSLMKL